ncbi:hypothetical protein BH24GEM3_BH24GEM3_14950 [soil metagenome]
MLTTLKCCLCSQIEGQPDNDLIARLLPDEPYVRRIMLESQSFAVIPSLGPLVSGHALLCPKTHVRSFAHLGRELYEECSTIKKVLIQGLRELYRKDVHIFEHGMAGTGDRVLCTVDHAHMHFLPLPATVEIGDRLDLREDGWTTYDGSLAMLKRLSGGHEYILYDAPDGVSRLLVSQDHDVESQYMRKVIAAELGHADHWNWRTAPDARAADDAWRRFASSSVCR